MNDLVSGHSVLLGLKTETKDLKITWWEESSSLLSDSDVRVRIWCEQHEVVIHPCINTSGCSWWCFVGWIFRWHTLSLQHLLSIILTVRPTRVLLLTVATVWHPLLAASRTAHTQ